MNRSSLFAFALLSLPSLVRADAHHQILGQTPIVKNGKTVGLRLHLLVDPDKVTKDSPNHGGDVRIGLGSMQYSGADRRGNGHRDQIAGVTPGYVLHQFKLREITGPNPTDRGAPVETLKTGGLVREVEAEVLYSDNPALKPGAKVDVVAGFWKGSYWHIWGSADGPMTSTQDFVISLPHDGPSGATSTTAAAATAPAPSAAPAKPAAATPSTPAPQVMGEAKPTAAVAAAQAAAAAAAAAAKRPAGKPITAKPASAPIVDTPASGHPPGQHRSVH